MACLFAEGARHIGRQRSAGNGSTAAEMSTCTSVLEDRRYAFVPEGTRKRGRRSLRW